MNTSLTEKDGIAIYLTSFFMMLLCSLPLVFISGDAGLFLSFLAPQIIYIAVITAYLRFKREPFSAAFTFNKDSKPISYFFIIFVAAGIYATNLIIGISFEWLLNYLDMSVAVTLPDLKKPLNLFLSLIIICIMPAIGEELMFRGIFLNILSKKSQRFAVVMSALIFALSHLNLSQFIYQFIFGIILGFIVIKTKNIVFSMIIHAFNNTIVVLLAVLLNSDPLATPSLLNFGIMAIISVVGIVMLIISLLFSFKYADKDLKTKDANIFAFLFKKSNSVCYNKDNERTGWLFVGLVCIFAFAAILNSFLS